MLYTLLFTIAILTLISAFIPLYMTQQFKKYVDARIGKESSDYTPMVSVIIPCKGTDLEFEQNILAFLSQDYPRYEILFVTATLGDPARSELEKILSSTAVRPAVRLLTAGIHPSRGQKLTNLLKGIESTSPDSEVLVFWDADIRVHSAYLRYLIAPLANPKVGATSGFPWYLPVTGNVGSILRSIWGGGALPILANQRRNFASGASNAIRRTVFAQGEVAKAMNRSISDTFAITNSVRRLGLLIEFVPDCLAVTPDKSTLLETLKWTNRQTIISRVYSHSFWRMVLVSYSMSNIALLLGLCLLFAGSFSQDSLLFLPAALILSLVPLEILNAAILLPIVQKMIPSQAAQLRRLRWKYYLLTPFASILIMINSLFSLTTNEIEWRGIRYRLIDSEHVEVLSSDNS